MHLKSESPLPCCSKERSRGPQSPTVQTNLPVTS